MQSTHLILNKSEAIHTLFSDSNFIRLVRHRVNTKDTSILDDDFPCCFMENHLIENVDNLADNLIIFLLG